MIANDVLKSLSRKKESEAKASGGHAKKGTPKELTCPICGITKLMCRSDAKTCGQPRCRKALQRKAKKEKAPE